VNAALDLLSGAFGSQAVKCPRNRVRSIVPSVQEVDQRLVYPNVSVLGDIPESTADVLDEVSDEIEAIRLPSSAVDLTKVNFSRSQNIGFITGQVVHELVIGAVVALAPITVTSAAEHRLVLEGVALRTGYVPRPTAMLAFFECSPFAVRTSAEKAVDVSPLEQVLAAVGGATTPPTGSDLDPH
jgi:hypothetical protein